MNGKENGKRIAQISFDSKNKHHTDKDLCRQKQTNITSNMGMGRVGENPGHRVS